MGKQFKGHVRGTYESSQSKDTNIFGEEVDIVIPNEYQEVWKLPFCPSNSFGAFISCLTGLFTFLIMTVMLLSILERRSISFILWKSTIHQKFLLFCPTNYHVMFFVIFGLLTYFMGCCWFLNLIFERNPKISTLILNAIPSWLT